MTNEQIVENWDKTGLLKNFKDKTTAALALQSQLKHIESNEYSALFNRISVPLAVRVLSQIDFSYKSDEIDGTEFPTGIKFVDKLVSTSTVALYDEFEYTAALAKELCDKLPNGISFKAISLKNNEIVLILGK